MKALNILMILTMCATAAFAGEITVSLDRAALVDPPPEHADELGNRIAVHFALPEEVENAEIIYAELHLPIDLSQAEYEGDTMSQDASALEFQAHNITSDWTEENPNCFAALDDSTFYTYTIDIVSDSGVYMDITEFVRSLAEGDAENYGLLLIPFKYDQDVFNLSLGVVSAIRSEGMLEIIYED